MSDRDELVRRNDAILAAKAKVAALPESHRAALEGEFQRAEQEARRIMQVGVAPIDKLLTPQGECRVINADLSMHWYPRVEPGTRCYCGKFVSSDDSDDD